MFKTAQYRAKAGEYGDLANTSAGLAERRSFRKLEQRFAILADNEQWLADNYQNTVRTEQERSVGATLADEEEVVLRCLGAALIMQWNTLPAKLQRELFDNAGAMGELLNTSALRGQIARFLHKHKKDEKTAEAVAAG
jgi:rubrerythrin